MSRGAIVAVGLVALGVGTMAGAGAVGCARSQEATQGSLGGTVTSVDSGPASSPGSSLSVVIDANLAQIAVDGAASDSPAPANPDLLNAAIATVTMASTGIAVALDPFLGKRPVSGKSIGHTSVAFKLTFDGGGAAAFKPTSHRGGKRWTGEVAAYRLAAALGLVNVPPAFAHTLDAPTLHAALDPAAVALDDQEVVASGANGATVEGALIPWIHDLEFPPVERDPLFTNWTTALRHDSPLPAAGSDDASLAAQMSTVVLFDLLDGNWDRWSGGNMGKQKNGSVYLYIDNDGAFYAHPPQKTLDRAWSRLAASDRFSRSFVAHLRTVDIAATIGSSSGNPAAIDASIVKSVDERRAKILATIDDKIKTYGEANVLVFP